MEQIKLERLGFWCFRWVTPNLTWIKWFLVLPLHVWLSTASVNPLKQKQWKLPRVFTHCCVQTGFSEHSSTSVIAHRAQQNGLGFVVVISAVIFGRVEGLPMPCICQNRWAKSTTRFTKETVGQTMKFKSVRSTKAQWNWSTFTRKHTKNLSRFH